MSIPGFTADASFYQSVHRYRITGGPTGGTNRRTLVQPAQALTCHLSTGCYYTCEGVYFTQYCDCWDLMIGAKFRRSTPTNINCLIRARDPQ